MIFKDEYGKPKYFGLKDALLSLHNSRDWSLTGNTIDGLWWSDENDIPPPTQEELEIEAERLKTEWINTEYQRKRKLEYPPVEDYLDAIVKSDTDAIQAYIDACQLVKQKYPKSTN